MTENHEQVEHVLPENPGPSETGPSLDSWKPAPVEEEPETTDVDWANFDSLPVKEKQRLLGVPVTGIWGDRSKKALKEARGE